MNRKVKPVCMVWEKGRWEGPTVCSHYYHLGNQHYTSIFYIHHFINKYYFFLLYCDRTVMYTCNLCRSVPFFLSFFLFSVLFMESSRCMLNPRVTAVYLWSTSLLKLFICTECCTHWNICCLLSQPKCLYLWFECRNTHSPSQKDLFNPCPDIISTDRV